jgi:dienelactone hydrolase
LIGDPEIAHRVQPALVFALGTRSEPTLYRPYAPVQVFHGTADEEVSPRRCGELVERSRAEGGTIDIRYYQDATHSFDDPSTKRPSNDANAAATEDAVQRSVQFFAQYLNDSRGGARCQTTKIDLLNIDPNDVPH